MAQQVKSTAAKFRIRRIAGAATLAIVGITLLTGCPGMSARDNEKFQARVARTVSPGMPFVTAIQKLVKAGFTCDDRSAAPLVLCTIDRQSLLPYACLERVALTTDSERRTVTVVEPRPIICAGL
jgi:hypothetical protein